MVTSNLIKLGNITNNKIEVWKCIYDFKKCQILTWNVHRIDFTTMNCLFSNTTAAVSYFKIIDTLAEEYRLSINLDQSFSIATLFNHLALTID